MSGSRETLSAEEARRVILFAQGLLGPRASGSPAMTLRRLGGVQLDTISVLARSHELVAYARHGAVPRASIEAAYWGPSSATFEYWSHAACVLPLEEWPSYEFRRRAFRQRGRRWHRLEDAATSCAGVLARLRQEGPLTARELGGAKKGGTWWDWSETKIAAEWLLDTGELVCRQRRGFQRVYDLAERAIPADLSGVELSDEECAHRLVQTAGRALGVATATDIAVYVGLPVKLVQTVVSDSELEPAVVQGWDRPAFVAPGALEVLGRRQKSRNVLISPFDSLTWDRARTARVSLDLNIVSRPTCRAINASMGTSPCRCSAETSWSVSSIPAGVGTHWWPSRSRCGRPVPREAWQPPWWKRRRGSIVNRWSLNAWNRSNGCRKCRHSSPPCSDI